MSFVRFLAIVPILTALGACAPSSFVTSKSYLGSAARPPAATSKYATNPQITKTSTPSSGIASFYNEGSQTASGEKFDPHELTAASPTLPFGTRLRVTNVANGRTVVVRINDRGPFVRGRAVDVSYSAAETLGMVGRGTAKVKLDIVQ
jgi:rare lipoprotein A